MQSFFSVGVLGAMSTWTWVTLAVLAFVVIPLVTGRALRGSSRYLVAVDRAELEVARAARAAGLTALADRRRLADDLPAALDGGHGAVAMLMVDVDHFDTYVSVHGQAAGDDALLRVAAVLAAHVRPNDVVYRYAGSELCVLLAGAKPTEAAIVAERIRANVESLDFLGASSQPGGRITVSVGLATTEEADPVEFAERADRALEAAKDGGHNRVAVAA